MDARLSELDLYARCLTDIAPNYHAMDDLPVAVYVTNEVGNIIYFNPAAETLWGRAPSLKNDKWCGSYEMYTLDGKFLPHHECTMAIALQQDRPVRGEKAIASRPNGTYYRFMPFPTPIHGHAGKLIGAVNMIVYDGELKDGLKTPEIDFRD